jgi:tetratricopeptide (TPR) repeat protein
LDQPQAVAVLQQQWGKDDRFLALALTNLGTQYIDARRLEDALPTLQQALAVLERTDLPRQHRLVCLAHHQLALAYQELGQCEKSIELDLENLRHREEALGKEHSYVLLTLLNLTWAYRTLDQYDKSLEFAELWLERNRRGLGAGHPDMERVLHGAGWAHMKLGRQEDAIACFRRAVEIQQHSRLPLTDYAVANSGLVARILRDSSPPRLEEAEGWARRAIEIAAKVTGRASRESRDLRHDLGIILKEQGKYAEAEQALLESIAISRDVAEGRGSLPAVVSLIDLYIRMGDVAVFWDHLIKRAVDKQRDPSS